MANGNDLVPGGAFANLPPVPMADPTLTSLTVPNALVPPGFPGGPPEVPEQRQISRMTWDQFKPIMQRYESRGQNVPNYMFDIGHTASGYNQITNSTWNDFAEKAGVEPLKWPETAMSRSAEEQDKVGRAIYEARGMGPWVNYDQPLAHALGLSIGGRGRPALPSAGNLPTPFIAPPVAPTTTPAPDTGVQDLAKELTSPSHLPGEWMMHSPLYALSILQGLMGKSHTFTPIDYDPWKYVPQTAQRQVAPGYSAFVGSQG